MNTTSSHLPICVHCGTPRPADETLCPKCGKPWIDTTIESAPVAGAVPPATTPTADTGAESEQESDGSAAGAVIAAGAVAGVAASNHSDSDDSDITEAANGSDSGEDQTDEAPVDGTSAAAAGAVVAGAAASNNTDSGSPVDESGHTADADATEHESPAVVPPPPAPLGPDDTGEFAFDAWTQPVEEENEPRRKAWLVPAGIAVAILAAIGFLVFGGNRTSSTTTVAAVDTTITAETTTTSATTTTESATTTAIAFPLPSDWPAKGEPIATDDLTLKQSAIGPIEIGMPIDDVAGVLTASLGEGTASGIDGLCPPDESYWLQFGQLTAIFDGSDSSSVFVSYRYDEPQGTDPELGLKTLSGIAIGDTVEDLINTYTQFTISFEIIDSKDHFRLSDGGDLLLWGPVSSVDPAGLIEGIYSPTACDETP